MTRVAWSRERVIVEIQRWVGRGVSPSNVWKHNQNLYGAAKRFHGSWRAALRAAGFESARRTWTKEQIIATIQAGHQAGAQLHQDSQLVGAANWHFGSWGKALLEAGVQPRSTRNWDRASIIAEIQALHRQGVPIHSIWRSKRGLRAAGCNHFGTWRNALAAAGFETDRQRWSRERVLDDLRELASSGCIPCSEEHPGLAAAARKYVGGWHQALAAAGIRVGEHCPGARMQEVIDAIRARAAQGLPLSSTYRDDGALYTAAKRTFGSWKRALKAAGYAMSPPVAWSEEKVLQEIAALRQRGQPLVRVYDTNPQLYWSAKVRFGGWIKALAAAGLDVKPRRRWTKRLVIEAIHDRPPEALSRTWREDKPLFTAAIRTFGNWEKALRAAGLNPKPRRRWSKQRVIEQLQAWDRNSTENLRTVDYPLAGAASRLFGSLEKAMEVAGVEPKNRLWPPRRVIEAIQDGYVRGLPIHRIGFGDLRLACAAKRRFGTWDDAVAAAGLSNKIPVRAPVRTWTKAAVIDAIIAWHEQGRLISNVAKQDQGLYGAAKQHFGSWRAAVAAAGLEPSRKKWSPERVIAEIGARHARGAGLTSGLVFREDPPLAGAAIRMFGSWRDAVAAAGLKTGSKVRRKKRKTE